MSAKIRIIADIKGSLMSGSDASREREEGSELAPVHVAHELYKKVAAEDYGDFKQGVRDAEADLPRRLPQPVALMSGVDVGIARMKPTFAP